MIKPYETTVTAKSISAKSRTSYHRFKLQKRKNSNSDITSIESKLAQMINTTKVRSSKYLLIKKHQLYKETRDKMLEFYCYSSWTRRKNSGQRRFKDMAYSTSARKIVRNVVFYGDSGRGHGSWIRKKEVQIFCRSPFPVDQLFFQLLNTDRRNSTVSVTNQSFIQRRTMERSILTALVIKIYML